VEVSLPAVVLLPEGSYETSPAGEPVVLRQAPPDQGPGGLTIVRVAGRMPASLSDEEKERAWTRLAQRLLRRTNRLLRWYRVLSRNSGISEVAQWQVSPFRMFIEDEVAGEVPVGALRFTTPNLATNEAFDETSLSRLREALASGSDPPVPDLFLQDAGFALAQGRFREAVLFAWATIDSEFNRFYDRLVVSRLSGDYSTGRNQLLGFDLGLRTKMTVVLHLLTKHSLFVLGQADGSWERLTASYTKRNGIIHRGDVAEQADAEIALEAAEWIIRKIDSIRAESQVDQADLESASEVDVIVTESL